MKRKGGGGGDHDKMRRKKKKKKAVEIENTRDKNRGEADSKRQSDQGR